MSNEELEALKSTVHDLCNAVLRIQIDIDEKRDLRDQFAMAALAGLLANPKLAPTILNKGPSWFDDNAWAYADAMMEARK
jgi:hypothetical protein